MRYEIMNLAKKTIKKMFEIRHLETVGCILCD